MKTKTTMSANIEDWSFKFEEPEPGEKVILLSETSKWLDDKLGDHNLPKSIRKRLILL